MSVIAYSFQVIRHRAPRLRVKEIVAKRADLKQTTTCSTHFDLENTLSLSVTISPLTYQVSQKRIVWQMPQAL